MLLLDEPLGALDLKLREQMQTELKTIQGEVGITFVYVTHDQDEALTMSDRIAVFNEGRVEQVSPPTELYERPENAFVAGFVGVSNLLERGRPAVHDPAREDQDPRPGRRAATGCAPSAGASSTSPTSAWSPATRSLSEAGGELQVVRQNQETTSADAISESGREVVVGWRPEHTVPVREETTNEEESP